MNDRPEVIAIESFKWSFAVVCLAIAAYLIFALVREYRRNR